jgi:hypothetical protein
MQKDTISQTGGISRLDELDSATTFPKKTNLGMKGWRQTAFVEQLTLPSIS